MEYRQLSLRLRVQRGQGRKDLVSERPHKMTDAGPVYSDSLEKPTIVTFDEHCQVDIEAMLGSGAIAEHAASRRRASKGDGEEGA